MIPMRKLAFLAAALLVMVGVGSAIKALTLAPTAAPPKATISIEDIHRQVDVKSLPNLDVKDPF
jgi:hypothetical protein